jgi:hypothetical protein
LLILGAASRDAVLYALDGKLVLEMCNSAEHREGQIGPEWFTPLRNGVPLLARTAQCSWSILLNVSSAPVLWRAPKVRRGTNAGLPRGWASSDVQSWAVAGLDGRVGAARDAPVAERTRTSQREMSQSKQLQLVAKNYRLQSKKFGRIVFVHLTKKAAPEDAAKFREETSCEGDSPSQDTTYSFHTFMQAGTVRRTKTCE